MQVEIELNGKCNLRCVMCPQSFGYDGRTLKWEEFKVLQPILETANWVTLHGGGEVLASPIFERVIEGLPSHIRCHFLTNGTLLDEVKTDFILKNNKIHHIFVSMDASRSETYRRIRDADFNLLMNNLRHFDAQRKKLGSSCGLKINMCVMKENIDEMLSFVELAKSLDAECFFWPLLPDMKHLEGGSWRVQRDDWIFDYQDQLLKDPDNFGRRMEDCKRLGEKIGVKVIEEMFHSPQRYAEPVSNCTIPFNSRLFLSNGEAKHCCMQTKPLFFWKDSGQKPFDQQERHVKVVELIAKGQIPLECSKSGCRFVDGALSDEVVVDHHPVDFRFIGRKNNTK